MSELFWVASPLIGFLGMMSGGYWGVGCGWIVVPTMLVLGMEPLEAVGIGLLQMVPATIVTVVKQTPEIGWSKGSPGLSLALPIGVGAVLTSPLGRPVNEELLRVFGNARPLQWMLIVFIALIALQTFCSRTASYGDAMPEVNRRKSLLAFAVGCVTGTVSSLLGVGGGIFTRPLLTSVFKVPEYYTSRIVRLLLLVTTGTGGVTYMVSSGGVNWHILGMSLLVAAGGIFGFPIGAFMHKTVYDAGYAQHVHKSFALVAATIPVNTLLNMYGFAQLSRYLMLAVAAGLTIYLVWFTVYAKKHPLRQNKKGA